MPILGWRWLLAFSALPSSLLLIFYGLTLESPRYLCMRGRTGEALGVLEQIARLNGSELPSGTLVSDNHIQLHEKSTESEDTKLLSPKADEEVTSKSVDQEMSGFSSVSVLLSKNLLRPTLLLWVVFFGNAFSYYGLVLLTTELNNSQNTCSSKVVKSRESQDISYRDVFITSFAGPKI